MPQILVSRLLRWSSLPALALLFCCVSEAKQARPGMPRAERHESRHEIDQLEQEWSDAIIHRDVEAMGKLLADDYIAITANGLLQSKDQTLENLKDGTLHLESITFSDRKVRFYGRTALVTSRAEVSGSAPDGDISGSYRYTRVYVRDGSGGWKIVSFEASKIRDGDEQR